MSRIQYPLSRAGLTPALISSLVLWGAFTAFGDQKMDQTDNADRSFIKEALRGDQSEMQLGKMAAEKSQNTQIKELGEHLNQDHAKADQELNPIAQKCGVSSPVNLHTGEQVEAQNLQGKSGADFDKAFAAHVIKDHEKDIDRYQKALQECKDPELRAFIEKNLPVLRQHLQMARSAGSAVGVDEKTLASADRYFTDQSTAMAGVTDKNQVDRTRASGRAAPSQMGTATESSSPNASVNNESARNLKHPSYSQLPLAVQNTVKADGDPQNIRDITTTTQKGQTIYVIKTERDGKNVTLRVADDGSLEKDNWFSRLFER